MITWLICSAGNYDECIDTVGQHEESKEVYFKGKYCAINYYPVRPASFDPKYLQKELPKAHMFRKLLKQFPTVSNQHRVTDGPHSIRILFPINMFHGRCPKTGNLLWVTCVRLRTN